MIKRVLFSLIESFIRNISGGIGQKIRYQYYKRRFKRCGSNVRVDIGVVFENPENIEIGNHVWIMAYSIVIARPMDFDIKDRVERKINNKTFNVHNTSSLKIGNEIQIGVYNIIHGFGGLVIEDRVTLSARVSIYSHSHYYRDEEAKSKITYANGMVKNAPISCIESPIVLEEGSWLGLGVSIFGGTVKKNSFVTANSVVIGDIEENSYASGNPAVRVKERFISINE